ncbi:pyrroloquinoline quinone biosynthesis protein PqqE [Actinoalloteichus sp. AHMU CJ021]|uniref:PqqA peptide cyclase n=2 Tax=Actinoalloteichus cyanogriseus TaxID=2893586 RepID=A0ABT1JIN1_ACTCY|nr:pyrroloquinoline quinone biosynthesis protein PqqE [Actinoalloteichus caeruleus]AUS78309.1 pyrroloquinoline quinone biosynthesis protein PqqE [Actinoalloteichus sp. AHMU CJ021]MCP2332378.1 pyrroloquinoline quinone biosynthesis protein E [Actinoalloteichus caeruleus DSM 43889]
MTAPDGAAAPDGTGAGVAAPWGMLAELTHRCPLHCPYCSNPLELVRRESELTTDQWIAVLDQARRLGVLQTHLSGGEPLARRDLAELVGHASGLGCYVSLVTSGLGLTPARAEELAARGLDHVQLSLQDSDATTGDRVAGTRAHHHKIAAAAVVRRLDLPLTVNVVLHRGNLDRIAEIILLAEDLGADRLELANTQYYGWGLRNRRLLMPTRRQLANARRVVAAETRRLAGGMEVVYVLSDYYGEYPKPCMHGWGSRQFTVSPAGRVLPCPTADVITGLPAEFVQDRPLAEIWYESAVFNAFRGTDWMRDPCRSCDRREIDFGGCRCQAFQLTGDARATDPVCRFSPDRHLVAAALLADAPEDSGVADPAAGRPLWRGIPTGRVPRVPSAGGGPAVVDPCG